jgi:hypothetical protein
MESVIRRFLLVADPAPILGLAAAVAWVSLVTVEFYEKIYRERIEKKEEDLRRLGKDDLRKLAGYIETMLTKGRSVDAQDLQGPMDRIGSLINARDELMRGRQRIFALLLVLSITSVGASYAPAAVFWSAEKPTTLIEIDYFVLAVVFLAGFWFLFKMFWFDSQILNMSRAEQAHLKPQRRDSSSHEATTTRKRKG